MSADLCLLSIHAHPDDESSKGASTVARYHAEGVRTVLVCCTGGELGDVVNPKLDSQEVRDNLTAVRREELAQAAKIIGFDEVVMLGYRDSGMPGSSGNFDMRCFHQAPLAEAVGRLVAIIRRTRPQVILTYGDDQQGYPHPDHLRVHDISLAAFDAAGDPDAYPWAGPAWQPQKMYYSVWSRARFLAMHERFLELGMESPFDQRWFDRPNQDDRVTTRIEVGDYYDVRVNALLAHATQIDPESKWWFGLPNDVAKTVHPYEEYTLARSLVAEIADETERRRRRTEASEASEAVDGLAIETDLFAGLGDG